MVYIDVFSHNHFTTRQTKVAYIGAFFFSGFIGGLNELWQMHVPHRGPSGGDLVANMIGAALFIWLFHLLKMRKQILSHDILFNAIKKPRENIEP